MIPKFNINGYLPKGIHKTTLSEIKNRFGKGSKKRKKLFINIKSLANLLYKHKDNIKFFLLNGSFVTSKESPEDFDCILVVNNSFDFSSPEAKQLQVAKILFNAHLFTFMEEDVVEYHKLLDFFGHDRDGKLKGLLEVKL